MIRTSVKDDVIYATNIDLSEDWTGDWIYLSDFNQTCFSLYWVSEDLDLSGTFYLDLAISQIVALGGGAMDTAWYHTVDSLVITDGVQEDDTSLWLTDPVTTCVTSARIRYVADETPGAATLNVRYFSKTTG